MMLQTMRVTSLRTSTLTLTRDLHTSVRIYRTWTRHICVKEQITRLLGAFRDLPAELNRYSRGMLPGAIDRASFPVAMSFWDLE